MHKTYLWHVTLDLGISKPLPRVAPTVGQQARC